MSKTTEELNEIALEIGKKMNGLTVGEANYIIGILKQNFPSKAIINFDSGLWPELDQSSVPKEGSL